MSGPRGGSPARRVEAPAPALLARCPTVAMNAQVGKDDACALTARARTLGVGAEERRLHAVRLGERLTDRLEKAGVGRGVAAPRALDPPWSTETTSSRTGTDPWISELLPDPATPVTTVRTPSGTSTSTPRGCWSRRRAPPATRSAAGPRPSAARDRRGGPVRVPLPRSPSTLPSKTISPPAVPGAGPRSTTWSAIAMTSGLCSTTSTVLPLSRSRSSSSFIRWMSCGCRPIVGSSKTYVTSVSDDPGGGPSWCAAPRPRQGAGGSVEAEVAEPDLDECLEVPRSDVQQRGDRGSSRSRTHAARSLTCMRARVGDADAAIVEDRAASVSRVPSHSGQVAKVTARSTNARMCGCMRRQRPWRASTSVIFGISPS